jgi:hypothetical protein
MMTVKNTADKIKHAKAMEMSQDNRLLVEVLDYKEKGMNF